MLDRSEAARLLPIHYDNFIVELSTILLYYYNNTVELSTILL